MEFRGYIFDTRTILVRTKRQQRFKKPHRNLYASIWPMMYMLRIFGVAPYVFSQGRLAPSAMYAILSIVIAALHCFILYVVYQKFTGSIWDRPLLGGTEYMKVFINYSVAMYEVGHAVLKRHSFARIWNALQDYDEDVRQLGYPRKEKRTTIVAWILTVIITLIWTVINRSGMHAFAEKWLYNVGYMLPYIGTSMAVYKLAAMVIFLGQRFRDLNRIAMNNFPSMSGTPTKTIAVSRKRIQSLHDELMLIAENLESLYSWSLLFFLANLSLHTVSNLYFIIEMMLKSWETIPWMVVVCLSSWSLAFLFQLLLLHIACNFASYQANCMGSILIEWQIRLMRKDKECIESSLKYLIRRLNFSAGGCFYVNLSLLRSIAALMTTYLVLLLQFPM